MTSGQRLGRRCYNETETLVNRPTRFRARPFPYNGNIPKSINDSFRSPRLTMRKTFLLFFLGLAVLAVSQSAPSAGQLSVSRPSPGAFQALETINPERIRAHVRFLSHDLLEGRGTGQRGGDIAAEYIATQYALYGLKPAGDNGTYLQKVPMVGITPSPETTFSLVPENGAPMRLTVLDDSVSYDQTQQSQSEIDAPIVFVGYGIHAPEYNWDDYKDTDVRGKVLLMLVNEPASDDPKFFKGKALTYYGRWTYKFEETARRGAIATIVIHRTDLASYGWQVVRNSWGAERECLKRDETPKVQAASWVQLDVAKKIVSMGGYDLDKLFAQSQTR